MLAIDLVLYVALAWYFDQVRVRVRLRLRLRVSVSVSVRVRVGVRVLRPRSPLSSP